MRIDLLPPTVQSFINDVEKMRLLQKRFCYARKSGSLSSTQVSLLLRECQKNEIYIDEMIILIKQHIKQGSLFDAPPQ
jgi:hypothetical protein